MAYFTKKLPRGTNKWQRSIVVSKLKITASGNIQGKVRVTYSDTRWDGQNQTKSYRIQWKASIYSPNDVDLSWNLKQKDAPLSNSDLISKSEIEQWLVKLTKKIKQDY